VDAPFLRRKLANSPKNFSQKPLHNPKPLAIFCIPFHPNGSNGFEVFPSEKLQNIIGRYGKIRDALK